MKRKKISWKKIAPSKTFTLKDTLKLFHNILSIKDKMLEANPNSERNMITHQGKEKVFTNIIMYTMSRWQALFKLIFITYFYKK
jgi:hypothetical protein